LSAREDLIQCADHDVWHVRLNEVDDYRPDCVIAERELTTANRRGANDNASALSDRRNGIHLHVVPPFRPSNGVAFSLYPRPLLGYSSDSVCEAEDSRLKRLLCGTDSGARHDIRAVRICSAISL